MDKKIIGYGELRRMFCAHEATHPTAHLTAHIVFTEVSFLTI